MFKTRAFGIGLAIFLISGTASLLGQTSSGLTAPSISAQAPVALSARQEDSYRPALQHRNPRYQVMRDDVLVLTFPLSPEFNQTVTIQPDGYVTLLGAGSVFIQGMTVPEVIEALKKAYSKILRDPIIDVDLKDFQKPFFIVLGQVSKPGQYDLRYDTTVTEAIAIAGSFTDAAKHSQVVLFRRVSDQWAEAKLINVKRMLHGANLNEDPMLQPGDMLYVPKNVLSKVRPWIPMPSLGVYANHL